MSAWPSPIPQPAVPPLDGPSGVPGFTVGELRLLGEWEAAKAALETAKHEEMKKRKALQAALFPDAKEGTHYKPLANGYKLKLGAKLSYKLNNEGLKPLTDFNGDKLDKRKAVDLILDNIAKIGNSGGFIADRLVKWEADLVLSEYRLLEADDASANLKLIKAEIDKVLTISAGAPSLEIVEPKGK